MKLSIDDEFQMFILYGIGLFIEFRNCLFLLLIIRVSFGVMVIVGLVLRNGFGELGMIMLDLINQYNISIMLIISIKLFQLTTQSLL
jgi:hypothetical protein